MLKLCCALLLLLVNQLSDSTQDTIYHIKGKQSSLKHMQLLVFRQIRHLFISYAHFHFGVSGFREVFPTSCFVHLHLVVSPGHVDTGS